MAFLIGGDMTRKKLSQMVEKNIIRAETPAHIYPDIKWLGIEKTNTILESCNEFQKILTNKNPDFERLTELSDNLFHYFIYY